MRWFDLQTRAAKILLFLERSPRTSLDELSQRLDVSKRTVQNEINQLNRALGNVAMIYSHKGEVRFYVLNQKAYRILSEEIKRPEETLDNPAIRLAYIADLLLSSRDYILIDDLAFNLNVSRSTLNKDLKDLKQILENYQLQITGKSNAGIRLIGKEYDIRRFILDNIFDLIYQKSILDQDIEEAFDEIMHNYQVEGSTAGVIHKYLILGLDRYLNGNLLQPFGKDQKWLEQYKLYEIVEKITDLLSSKLGIDLPVNEKIFLIIPMIGMRTPLDLNNYTDLIDISDTVIELANKIIQNIKQRTDISFQFDESLEEFIYHLNFLSNRLEFKMYLENPVKEQIKEKYGFAWSIAEQAASIIEKELNRNVNEDEIGFLTSYFEIIIKEQKQRRRKQTKILVLHLQGGATRRLITYQLEKILDSDVELEFKSYKPAQEIDTTAYDLIITTGNLDLETNLPVIILDEVVDDTILKQQIDQYQLINSSSLISNTKRQSTLLSLLSDDDIIVFDHDYSYPEALFDLVESAVRDSKADLGFYDRLIEREKRATMDFSKKLSFPHTVHLNGETPFIRIGLTPNGLKDKLDLRVIILAGLPEKADDDITLVQLYEEVLKLGEDSNLIDHMSQLSSYHDLYSYLLIEKQVFD